MDWCISFSIVCIVLAVVFTLAIMDILIETLGCLVMLALGVALVYCLTLLTHTLIFGH